MSAEAGAPSIASVAGPLVLGHLFNWGLFGTLTVQVYLYYLAFPNDRRGSKLLVLFIYLFEFAQTLIATHDAFAALGSGWGNPAALKDPQLAWLSLPMMSGIMSCTVQIFYAWRIYILSRSPHLSLFIVTLAIIEGAAAIVQGVQALKIGDLSILQDHAFKSDAVWLATSAGCDAIIAFTMTYFLLRSNTGFWRTKLIILRLVGLAIGAGMITATVALVDLTLFLAFRQNNYHFTPALVLAKLYSNSLLVQLNSRIQIVGGRDFGVSEANNTEFKSAVDDLDFLSLEGPKAKGRRRPFSMGTAIKRSQRSPIASHQNSYPLNGISVSVTTHLDTDQEAFEGQITSSTKFSPDDWTAKSQTSVGDNSSDQKYNAEAV